MRKVFVSGMGAVSPYGIGAGLLGQKIREGVGAVVNVKAAWDGKISDLNTWVAAPLAQPLDPQSIPRKMRRSMGPLAMMAYVAAEEAVRSADLACPFERPERVGVSFGSSTGSVRCLDDVFLAYHRNKGMGGLLSGSFFQIMSHTCASNLAHAFGLGGYVVSPNAACASATMGIGLGYEAVRDGKADIMICGGADELHPMVSGTFDLVQAASTHFNDRPDATPRPFDRDRDGTVCGEGAGALVLESESSLMRRGGRAIAEIIGFASCNDGAALAQSNEESILRCLHNALDIPDLLPDAVAYVNAHGTGTVLGDAAEARAIARFFGDKQPPVSGLKGYFGHTLGASGALELIASLILIREKRLPPNRNLEIIAEDCSGLDLIREEREIPLDQTTEKGLVMIKNSFAFGGLNSVLVARVPLDTAN
jgi:3-oxoacyl-[acyl-carrier-protein] synthase II